MGSSSCGWRNPIIHSVTLQRFQSVEEQQDVFLALFPHRYDYIWAPHVAPGEAVEWQTERRYPLSDRHINQGSSLYGVRFGAKTHYCLVDIDVGSPYHPKHDPFAISRLVASLEPLGIVRYLACTSSYSGGIHLYFPFEPAQSSYQIAIAVSVLLENAGFVLKPGHLEVFPNPKPYSDEPFSLFNAHRLPLQSGSYLLNKDFQPVWSERAQFVERWHFAQRHNDVTAAALRQILKQSKRHRFHISGKADQFLNDLNAEIEVGWTGPGQTNRLLGRITMRSYIFHHVLQGGSPLTGTALVHEIVRVARSLPGYSEWCRHQHEIEHRAEEWARCIENSHYFAYGDASGKYKAQAQTEVLQQAIEAAPSWNQQQSDSAREKIRSAIADLLEKESLPSSATARFKALLEYRIGGGSLYRHKDLWHPNYLRLEEEASQNLSNNQSQNLTSLLPSNGGNDFPSLTSRNSDAVIDNSTENHFLATPTVNRIDLAIESTVPFQPMSVNPETWLCNWCCGLAGSGGSQCSSGEGASPFETYQRRVRASHRVPRRLVAPCLTSGTLRGCRCRVLMWIPESMGRTLIRLPSEGLSSL